MTEKEIEACLQKQLSILESAYIVLLVSPDNMEDGWKIHSDRDRFKYKFRKFQDPTRLINTISCLMVDKVRIKYPYDLGHIGTNIRTHLKDIENVRTL